MYCKKCHTLLEESSSMCPNCYYDNNLDLQNEATQEFKAIKIEGMGISKTKNKLKPITLIIILLLIGIGLIILYMVKDKNSLNEKDLTTTIVTTTTEPIKAKKFNFNAIELEYGENFGSSANTIFYKNNSNINIEVSTISQEQYTNQTSIEAIDAKLGDLDAKTIAGDLFYSYLFMHNNEYYDIKVNFIDDENVYTVDVQSEIVQILSTIKFN